MIPEMPRLRSLKCEYCPFLLYAPNAFVMRLYMCKWLNKCYTENKYNMLIKKLIKLQRWVKDNLRSRWAQTTLDLKLCSTKFLHETINYQILGYRYVLTK